MIVFAHRGASAHAPQNTLPALKKAMDMGGKNMEVDVQLSSDGVPVLIHDFTLEKTTNLTGFVHRKSWKELQKADAGSWFDPEYRGTKLPSLEEALALVPGDICLNIEIKSLSFLQEPVVPILADLLAQEKGRNIIVSSFNHPVLREFQDFAAGIPLGMLTASALCDPPGYVDRSGIRISGLHSIAYCISKAYTEMAHARGWKVYCYTVNDREQGMMLQEMGVDGLFSDYPDLMEGL